MCSMDTIEICSIETCSNTLKKSVLWGKYGYEVERLQISTPNLLYFNINVISMGEIMLLNFPLLGDASIHIDGWYDQNKYVTSVPKLIRGLSNVESLRLHALDLYSSGGEVLKMDFYDCPVFNNLKRLKLLDWHLNDFDFALFFLHSPKLFELTLEYKHRWAEEIFDMEATQEVPRDAFIQREFLKNVRIVEYENNTEFVDQLINKLLTHVKIIGDIVFDP